MGCSDVSRRQPTPDDPAFCLKQAHVVIVRLLFVDETGEKDCVTALYVLLSLLIQPLCFLYGVPVCSFGYLLYVTAHEKPTFLDFPAP